ncbi:hypothetical protein QQF73_04865 [Marinobacter sp. M216]|uniref:Lipoprotein n=1 Tax=Marinobacter albus TaxID=3030833 RepID=A0ABT7H9E0_9GAMM|nr:MULTISPECIES: hypothetical protein [unclassified Marinobacter]MBW7470782.1 hypothetical protein [Marinobacter sp. F4218]MDK9556948.1 hypothetical protein [Marinobacter sp. M216]
MKHSTNRLFSLGAIVAAALMAGCVPPSAIKPVDNLSQIDNGKVIVVGKIELTPELEPDEQVLGSSYEEYRNLALVITDTELRQPADQLGIGALTRRINAPLGDNFFVSHEAQPFFILRSWLVMNAEIKVVSPNYVHVPGNAPLLGMFGIDVQPDDRAIYIGTIRYHRDTFFGTEKVEVIDNYQQAKNEFASKFGEQVQLRKSLAMPVMNN